MTHTYIFSNQAAEYNKFLGIKYQNNPQTKKKLMIFDVNNFLRIFDLDIYL